MFPLKHFCVRLEKVNPNRKTSSCCLLFSLTGAEFKIRLVGLILLLLLDTPVLVFFTDEPQTMHFYSYVNTVKENRLNCSGFDVFWFLVFLDTH